MGVFSKMFEKPELPKRKYCFTEEEARFFKSSGIKTCELAIFKIIVFFVMAMVLLFCPLFSVDIGIAEIKISIFDQIKQSAEIMANLGYLMWIFPVGFFVTCLGMIGQSIYGAVVYSNKKAEELIKKKERRLIKDLNKKGKIKKRTTFFGTGLGTDNLGLYVIFVVTIFYSFMGEIGRPAVSEQIVSLLDVNVVPIAAIIIFVVGNVAFWLIDYFQKVAYKPHFEMFKQKFDESIENAEKEEEEKKLEQEQKKVLEEQKQKEEAERQAKEKEELYQKMKDEIRAEIKKEQDEK